jgi:hypothetical protein
LRRAIAAAWRADGWFDWAITATRPRLASTARSTTPKRSASLSL